MRRPSAPILAAIAAGAIMLAAVGVAFANTPSPDASESPAATAEVDPTTEPTVDPTIEPTVDPTTEPTVDPTAEPAVDPTPEPPASPEPVAPEPVTNEVPDPDLQEETTTITGVLRVETDADGRTTYLIGDTRLSVGPPWFWGDKNPLARYVGQTVTVTGHVDDGQGGRGRGVDDGPEFDVRAVNGTTVREAGRPPWAGGPAVVGASHPGYAGWSRGQANRGANAPGNGG